MFVVVRGVGAEDGRQVTFAEDKHSVGAFAPDGAYPAFGDCVRAWRLRRRLDDLDVVGSLVVVDQQIPGLLGDPPAVGRAVVPATWTRRVAISTKNST
jgi:hypothetical protein